MENLPQEVYGDQPDSWLRERMLSLALKAGAGIVAFSAIISSAEFATESQAAEIACADIGELCSWGGNGGLELGNNSDPYVISQTPGRISLKEVTDVADGGSGSDVAVQSDGTVWQWGYGYGLSEVPEKVIGISNAVSVAAGSSRYALLADGHVVSWGQNNYGQLGNNSTASSSVPVEVQGLKDIISIASGLNTAYALDKEGAVWAWGNGHEGRLGTGKAENSAQHNNLTPSKIAGLSNVKDIGASASNGYALRVDGTVMAWGTAYNDLLGTGTTQNAIAPQEVPGLKNIKSLGTNTPSSTEFAIDNSGKAWAWGSGRAGALGDNKCNLYPSDSTPVQVPGLSDVVSITGSERSAFAVTSSGEAYGWGYNDQGTLGANVAIESCSGPVRIPGLEKVSKVVMGNLAAFAIGAGAQASLPPDPKPLKYVALGDSYSSGEGAPNPKFIAGTDQKNNMCHRSTAAYSNVFFNANSEKFSSLIFRACSGATIEDFYKSNVEGNKNEPSQLSWLKADTGLITLTIGGNDIGFGKIMAYCATRYHTYQSCESKYSKVTNTKITGLGKASVKYSLPRLYTSIKEAAPNAEVAVLGYPRIFPTNPPKTCATGVGNLKFSKSDMMWMNSMSAKLNSTIRISAQKAGFKYVDVQNSLQGHELCTKAPYVNRAILDATNPNILNQINWSFHPKAAGHKLFANILQKQLG